MGTSATTNIGLSGSYGKVSVTTSATLIKKTNGNRCNITMVNEGSVPIRVGFDTSVTAASGTTDGIYVAAGACISLDTALDIYAISTSGTVSVSYIEQRATTN